jgi:hypothetical protein
VGFDQMLCVYSYESPQLPRPCPWEFSSAYFLATNNNEINVGA